MATKPKFGKTKELKDAARKMREASAAGAHGVPATHRGIRRRLTSASQSAL